MPQMQALIPDALYDVAKQRQLNASKLAGGTASFERARLTHLKEKNPHLSLLIEGEAALSSVPRVERLAQRREKEPEAPRASWPGSCWMQRG
jgi:hypothetical protein